MCRDSPAAGNWSDCHPCPAGNYCPDTNATTNGTQCIPGDFCPEGSQLPTSCQPGKSLSICYVLLFNVAVLCFHENHGHISGYYCNMSKTQVRCPPGFYCPLRSEYPRPCPMGHYCEVIIENGDPRGAIEPVKCPLGKLV